jgi:vacuolar protein sorting-associated protein 18
MSGVASADLRGHSAALHDPVFPRFETTTYPLDDSKDLIEDVDCQSGILALLRRSGRLELRDMEEDRLVQRVLVRNPHRVFVHPSGSYVLTTASDGEVYVHDTYGARASASTQLHTENALGVFLQGSKGVVVGECVGWLPKDTLGTLPEEEATVSALNAASAHATPSPTPSSHATSRAVDWTCLMGADKGSAVFAVRVRTSTSNPSRLRITATVAWALPSPAASSLPTRSVIFELVGPRDCVLLISTTTHLHVALSSEVDTPAALFCALASGEVTLQTRTVPLYAGTASTAEANGQVRVFRSSPNAPPQSFVWNSATGVVHGVFHRPNADDIADENERLLFCGGCGLGHRSDTTAQEGTVSSNDSQTMGYVIDFARIAEQGYASSDLPIEKSLLPPATAPLAVIPTAFHMLLVYPKRCMILHHPPGLPWRSPADGVKNGTDACAPPTPTELLQRLRFDPFRTASPPTDLCGSVHDADTHKLLLFSRTNIWEVQIEDEAHQQWRVFFEHGCNANERLVLRKRFLDAACRLAFYSDAQRNLCQFYRAKFFLDSGATRHAIALFANCDWFEDVYALLTSYRNVNVRTAFVEARFRFLLDRLTSLDDWAPQLTTLFIILVLAKLDQITRSATASQQVAKAAEEELHEFLNSTVQRCGSFLTQKPVYGVIIQILEEQGRRESALLCAKALQQTRYVVSSYVAQHQYDEAVKVLATCYGSAAKLRPWYDYTSTLIRHRPVALITALLRVLTREARAGRVLPLSMERLIPSFVQYEVAMNEVPDNREHQVVVLLDQCIHRYDCASPAVHNYFVCLLAQTKDHDRLDDFISTSLFYDAGYALRACLEHGCIGAAVALYKHMHLFRDAVTTALYAPHHASSGAGSDVHDSTNAWPGFVTAEDTLRGLAGKMPQEDLKQLWMLTAEQALASHNVGAALAVVQESGGTLCTGDVLSRIEDASVVGDYRDAICEAFDAYALKKKQLCKTQDEVYETAEGVKKDLRQTRQQFGYLTASQRCPLCHRPLLQSSMPYFVYPTCGHVVHEACAVARLEAIGGLEAFLADDGIPPHVMDGVRDVRQLAQQDCVLCGEAVVVEVDMPLCVADASWTV